MATVTELKNAIKTVDSLVEDYESRARQRKQALDAQKYDKNSDDLARQTKELHELTAAFRQLGEAVKNAESMCVKLEGLAKKDSERIEAALKAGTLGAPPIKAGAPVLKSLSDPVEALHRKMEFARIELVRARAAVVTKNDLKIMLGPRKMGTIANGIDEILDRLATMRSNLLGLVDSLSDPFT